MVAYNIDYKIRNDDTWRNAQIDARDLKSAKKKIGRKHGYKDGRMIIIHRAFIVGYF